MTLGAEFRRGCWGCCVSCCQNWVLLQVDRLRLLHLLQLLLLLLLFLLWHLLLLLLLLLLIVLLFFLLLVLQFLLASPPVPEVAVFPPAATPLVATSDASSHTFSVPPIAPASLANPTPCAASSAPTSPEVAAATPVPPTTYTSFSSCNSYTSPFNSPSPSSCCGCQDNQTNSMHVCLSTACNQP